MRTARKDSFRSDAWGWPRHSPGQAETRARASSSWELFADGTAPSSGRCIDISSPGCCILLDRTRSRTSPMPPTVPMPRPIAIFRGRFGLYGALGGSAGSITRTLLICKNEAAPASLVFSKTPL